MTGVTDDVWSLLAKYLFNEASPPECSLVEVMLSENESLRNYYQQLQTVLLLDDYIASENSVPAFAKLDLRIKNSIK